MEDGTRKGSMEYTREMARCKYTANEGLLRIQYECPVPIYVFPEMKLSFPKQNYNVLSPSSYTHISVRDLYIFRIGLPIQLLENLLTDPGNILIAHRHMSVEIKTEAAQFPEKECINGIFVAVYNTTGDRSEKLGIADLTNYFSDKVRA